jgi:hypothetical protein
MQDTEHNNVKKTETGYVFLIATPEERRRAVTVAYELANNQSVRAAIKSKSKDKRIREQTAGEIDQTTECVIRLFRAATADRVEFEDYEVEIVPDERGVAPRV